MTKRIITLSSGTGWKGLAAKLLVRFEARIKKDGYKRDNKHLRIFFGKRKDTDQSQEKLVLLNWPNRWVESFEVIQSMKRDKIRPVGLSRFLYIGQKNPKFIELAKESTIVTFGSFWESRGTIYVPVFYKDFLEYPDLFWFSELWGQSCWFAGLTN